MKNLKIKVCGMRDRTNIESIAALAPDFMGFIQYEKSPRYVGSDFSPPSLSSTINRVGVFVNETFENIMYRAEHNKFDLVQLHGDESIELVKKLSEQNIRIIKTFSVNDEFDFSSTTFYTPHVSFFLFDTKGLLYGGNAIRFNWEILKNYKGNVPFFLSGGIGIKHIDEINALSHPMLFGIDINSGVEDAPGTKNKDLIKELIERIK